MIRLKTLITETATKQHVIITNNNIKKTVTSLLGSRIKNNMWGQRTKLINAVSKYIDIMNSNANLILQQIRKGNGTETASLYIDSFKKLVYDEVNNLNGVTKLAIAKLMSAEDLRKSIDIDRLNEIYDALFITTLMNIHDPSSDIESTWYTTAWNVLHNRRDAIIKHLIDYTIQQIY